MRDHRLPTIVLNDRKFRVDDLVKHGHVRVVSVDGTRVSAEILGTVEGSEMDLLVRVDRKIFRVAFKQKSENSARLVVNGNRFTARLIPLENSDLRSKVDQHEGPIIITAPMAGRIVSLKVRAGDAAAEGQSLVILEAMKMENEIASPKRGTVKQVYVQPGALVRAGDTLAVIE